MSEPIAVDLPALRLRSDYLPISPVRRAYQDRATRQPAEHVGLYRDDEVLPGDANLWRSVFRLSEGGPCFSLPECEFTPRYAPSSFYGDSWPHWVGDKVGEVA